MLSSRQFPSTNARDIRVTTYNVLSSHLCEPEHFAACKPEFLDQRYRLAQLKQRLTAECASNAIICLQEVSTLWAGQLHPFFASKGYYFVNTHYGHKFNGYMGVGIAVPMSKYEVLDVDIARISDTKRGFKQLTKDNVLTQFLKAWFIDPLLKLLRTIRVLKPVPENPWSLAASRFNQMVCVRLNHRSTDTNDTDGGNDTKKPFVVGTYHMPCMFKLPGVMSIHTALSAQYIYKYAAKFASVSANNGTEGANGNGKGKATATARDPVIFCGDFNIKPIDHTYKYLISGVVDPQEPSWPAIQQGDNYSFALKEPFRSAYKECSPINQEPAFTNWAKIREEPEFIETLDYIFVSDDVKIVGVDKLPTHTEAEGPLPSQNEPSDHLLLSATLSLEK